MPRSILPDSYEDLFRRAQTTSRMGDVEEALSLYERLVGRLKRLSSAVLARRPELREMLLAASLHLVELLRSVGRFAEAIEVEEGLLVSHPDDARSWRRDIALLRAAKGESERGLRELQALAEERPDEALTWLILGDEARDEGWYAESEVAFERAVEAARREGDPRLLARVYYGRFRLFEAMGRVDEALAAWEEARSHDRDVQETIGDVYRMLTDAGRFAEAQTYVARDTNRLRAGLQRGMLAQLTGDLAKARKEWQAVAALDPLQFDVGQESWMEAVLRLGDPQPVLEKVQHLLQRPSARLLVLWGIALAMAGREDLTKRVFELSIRALRRDHPSKQKLDGADWQLLNSLVKDPELKANLRRYFAAVETVWG